MNTLTLNGVSSDFVYQKSLDTVQKRHHVRLWKYPRVADVWLGAAAQDIGFRFQLAHWTHSTSSKIDNERAKVVNDAAYTGCVQAAGLVARDSPDPFQSLKGDQLVLTDSDVAVVRLNECNKPKIMPGVDTASRVLPHSRLSRGLASLRNDLRLNVLFTTYNTLRFVAQRHALKPLRKVQSSDADPPGLDWLNSVPVQGSSHSGHLEPDVLDNAAMQ